jgi:hypothetical protein
MSTTESLLVITDEVAKITMLLIPNWSRDSYRNRIDIMPMMWYLWVSIETVMEKVVERRSSNNPVGLLSLSYEYFILYATDCCLHNCGIRSITLSRAGG